MRTYEWEVAYHDEMGTYYIQKLIWMSLPATESTEYETFEAAQRAADLKNEQESEG